MFKVCINCKYKKSIEQFHFRKDTKKYRNSCIVCENFKSRQFHEIHKVIQKQKLIKYYYENKEKFVTYQEKNRLKILEYLKQRRKENISFRILDNLRRRLRYAIKTNIKSESLLELLSCTIPELKQYLENQFKPGMNWNNYGDWEIDHIKPCSKFDLSIPEEQQQCFHYKNLQPLWAIENRQKSNKYAIK